MLGLPRRLVRTAKSGAAALCLGIYLLLQLMAAVPAFHAWVHPDANDPAHNCAVTLLTNGEVHSPAAEVTVVSRPPPLVFQAPLRDVAFVSADIRLLPGRDPPV